MDNNQRYIDISIAAELVLFRLSESKTDGHKEIVFLKAGWQGSPPTEIRKTFDDYVKNTMIVRVGTSNAKAPRPIKKKIGDIIGWTDYH